MLILKNIISRPIYAGEIYRILNQHNVNVMIKVQGKCIVRTIKYDKHVVINVLCVTAEECQHLDRFRSSQHQSGWTGCLQQVPEAVPTVHEPATTEVQSR